MAPRTIKIPADIELHKDIYRIRFLAKPPKQLGKVGSDFRLYPGKDNTYFISGISLRILRDLKAKFEIVEEIEPERAGVTISFPLETVLHDLPNEDVREEIVALALSRKDRGKSPQPVYCGRTRELMPGTFVLDRPGGQRHYRWRWDSRKRKKKTPTFYERFPKLIKHIKDKDTRFVVSLGGGGLRMFAHPSIFKLIEAMGAKGDIDEIWGCSGGAIAGLAYSLGADHQIIEQEGYDLYHKKYDLRLSPSTPEVVKNLLLSRLLPGTTVSLKGFVDIQNAMQNSLARVAKYNRPSIPFYAVAYNMNVKRNEVLTPEKVDSKFYEGHIKHCSPINSVLASAAIPILFVPRVIKRGKTPYTYIDGSLFEEVPLPSIYYKWRMDRKHGKTNKKKIFILAVNLFPYLSTWRVFGHFLAKYIPVLELVGILSRLADLARRARIDEQIRSINHDAHAYVAEVNLPRLSKFNFLDPQIIPTVIDKARGTFFDQLLKIESELH
jgi:predicted acylesterase/phospholipase RssA